MNQRFGPYQVGDTVGRGTFAKVKVAVHEATQTRVALKIIPRKILEQDKRSSIKITREIKILKVLRHPNIMRLFDVVQTKHDIVLVLEYVSGGELFDCICRRGRLDESTARYYFQQIVAGVAYCHRHRVAHRDIKPENIMIDQGQQNVKIGDFGLSSVVHDGCFFETSCGTPNYASPEVVSGKLYGGPETDVWSCGVVLYTMIAGALPFDDQNVGNLFKKIQHAQYTMPKDVSDSVQDLLRRMLVVSPLERATMEQVMQHPWVQPGFPKHLLARHYDAIFDSMLPARSALATDNMLDEALVEQIAVALRMSVHEVTAIVAVHEKRKCSILGVAEGDTMHPRYPAKEFFETYSSVVDAKLWPEPLVIPPAEQALRDIQHDALVSYLILQHHKQSQIPPEHMARITAHTEAAGSLILSLSMSQGYGSLNANSLRLVPVSGPSSNKSPHQQSTQGHPAEAYSALRGVKDGGATFFGSLPAYVPQQPDAAHAVPGAAGAGGENDDSFMAGYNRVVAVSLPLVHPFSRHTLLGSLLCTPEHCAPSTKSSNATRAKQKHMPLHLAVGRGASHNSSGSPSATRITTKARGAGGGHVQRLLKPLADDGSDTMSTSTSLNDSGSVLRPKRDSRGGTRGGAGTNRDGNTHISGFEAQFNVLHCEAAPRFGNDFMRNGVLFNHSDPVTTLRCVYRAMREEGFMWKVIHPYFFAAIIQPSVKLQVKVYKVTPEEQLVDIKVSSQSGMSAYDAAAKLLERLRKKSIALENIHLRKKLLVGNQSLLGSSGDNSFAASAAADGSFGQRAAARAFPA